VKEHPILFSGPMVRAILNGTKTQTRRVARDMPSWVERVELAQGDLVQVFGTAGMNWRRCPYGASGDRLWVRETWVNNFGQLLYRADCYPDSFEYGAKGWKPSIHMPRALSRITLEITGVRVERLQDISKEDACAELGCPREWPGPGPEPYQRDPRGAFANLWDEINPKHPWSVNSWVWVVAFKQVQQ
jgi:hypothetical protein